MDEYIFYKRVICEKIMKIIECGMNEINEEKRNQYRIQEHELRKLLEIIQCEVIPEMQRLRRIERI